MTPGPTGVPDRVLLAGNRVLHHRTPEFSRAIGDVLMGLRFHFGASSADILPVHGTGRASMEAALVNLFSPGDEIVACCNGKFGQMWAGFGDRYGLRVHRVAEDWDRSVDPDEVARTLADHPAVRGVLVVHSDTSTGVLNPVKDVARVGREAEALVLVDGISSIGGAPFRFDEWDLDVAITASQKCLMSSPGLSFVALNERAWAARESSSFPRAYFDFGAIRESLSGTRPETPGTTPVSLMLQVREALAVMGEGGDPGEPWARNVSMAARVRGWATARGFRLQGGDGILARSPTLTALETPTGLDVAALRAGVLARGILVASGLGPYRGKGIRIAHMGNIRMADVERTLEALDGVLEEMGTI